MLNVESHGDFKKTMKFLNFVSAGQYAKAILDLYGRRGVEALSSMTPRETGKTAASWGYEVNTIPGGYELVWTNSNVNGYVSIALILQTGHGTGTGGYVRGIDYINPALVPVFNNLSKALWKEVVSA